MNCYVHLFCSAHYLSSFLFKRKIQNDWGFPIIEDQAIFNFSAFAGSPRELDYIHVAPSA